MSLPVYIGDAVSAAGYRLAGLRIHVPDTADIQAEIEQACGDTPLVLLGADIAGPPAVTGRAGRGRGARRAWPGHPA